MQYRDAALLQFADDIEAALHRFKQAFRSGHDREEKDGSDLRWPIARAMWKQICEIAPRQRSVFSKSDLQYKAASTLQKMHPGNNHPGSLTANVLKYLRDHGYVEPGDKRGDWRRTA